LGATLGRRAPEGFLCDGGHWERVLLAQMTVPDATSSCASPSVNVP
jgi:hypothetical protein